MHGLNDVSPHQLYSVSTDRTIHVITTDTSVLATVGSSRFNGTASSFETSGYEHPLIQCHIPEECNSQLHRCENLKILVSENHLFTYGYSNTDTQSSTVTVQRSTKTAMTISGEHRRETCATSCLAPWHAAYTSASPVVRDTYRHGALLSKENRKRIQNAYLLKAGNRTCSSTLPRSQDWWPTAFCGTLTNITHEPQNFRHTHQPLSKSNA